LYSKTRHLKKQLKIKLFNRQTGKFEIEDTYRGESLWFLYNTFPGKVFTNSVLNKHLVSRVYGSAVKSRQSKSIIHKFVEHYDIDLSEVKKPLGSFRSFNDFFIRELSENARPIDQNPYHLIAPADSRLLVFDLKKNADFPVKGYWYSMQQLVKEKNLASEYNDGWCFIYRLAPADYHRFCYIDNGTQEKVKRIRGALHSVNPIALSSVNNLLSQNYRILTILRTQNFGEVLHLEVGALLVGKIVLRNRQSCTFKRGEEKGWFEYGGSTIIQIFRKDAVKPDSDILKNSLKNIETLVKMGEKTGKKPKKSA
jgi:phosphatidylserine decarboxylase